VRVVPAQQRFGNHRAAHVKALADVAAEATGHTVGDVETFASLLARRPDANQTFWRAGYFGCIPWDRETVTPASLLRSREMRVVCESASTRRDQCEIH